MQNVDLPASVVIPGDPAALRAAARGVRTVAGTTGQEASRQALAAREASAAGWTGPAGDAFRAAATDGRARIDELVAVVPDIGPPLLAYADVLERSRREYDEVRAGAQGLAARMRATPRDAPGSAALDEAYLAADARLTAIVAEVDAADRAAADALAALGARLTDPETAARQRALVVSTSTVSYGLAAQVERVAAELGRDSPAARAGKLAGRVLGPVGFALGQTVQDAENPNYSGAERVGRAIGRALLVGVPATAVGATVAGPAGVIGGSLGGPLAPLTAFVAGAGAWAGASALVTAGIDAVPLTDDAIDASGEAFDRVAEQLGSPS